MLAEGALLALCKSAILVEAASLFVVCLAA